MIRYATAVLVLDFVVFVVVVVAIVQQQQHVPEMVSCESVFSTRPIMWLVLGCYC